MDDNAKIRNLFRYIEDRFTDWLKGKPTGQFGISINVNEGGIRGGNINKKDVDDNGVECDIREKV